MNFKNKVEFVVIGGMKCGSTAIGDYFCRHPEVNFCKQIETDYFSHNQYNVKNENEYFKLYYKKEQGIKGESSPTYSYLSNMPETPKKLVEHNPDIKVILIVRNPIKRIESNINHNKLQGIFNSDSIEMYLEENSDIIRKSMFGSMIDNYLKYIPESNFIVVKFEDLISNTAFSEVCSFLGINNYPDLKLREINKTDKRYVELPIWRFYKKNWKKLQYFKIPQTIRQKIKLVIDKLFSRKISNKEIINVDSSLKLKIKDKLIDDSIKFEKHMGYSYYQLSK